jgi:hypothetical protein
MSDSEVKKEKLANILKKNQVYTRCYFILSFAFMVLFIFFFIRVELYVPIHGEVNLTLVNGVVTTMGIIYSMTIFAVSRPSYLFSSQKLWIIYIDTFYVASSTAVLYLLASGLAPLDSIRRCVDFIFFFFLMAVENFAFLLVCSVKYQEETEDRIMLRLIEKARANNVKNKN